MIIDAHLHVWDKSRARYDWLGPHLKEVDRDIRFDEVAPLLSRLGVGGVVLVQSADNVEDTLNMLDVSNAFPRVCGVVGWVPLEHPRQAARMLDTLALRERLVGGRNLIHDRDDPDWVLTDAFGDGLDLLAAHRLPFDFVTSSPAALSRLDRVAFDHPDVTFVLDHLAKPPINGDDDAYSRWERALRLVAAHPNTVAKISGLYSSLGSWDTWTQSEVDRVVGVAVDAFGPERLMYGGDWPMPLLAGGYERVFTGLQSAVQDWPSDAAAQFWCGTAVRTYGLDVGDSLES